MQEQQKTRLDCGGAEKVACNVTFGGLSWLSPPVPIRARILVVPPLNNLKKKKKNNRTFRGISPGSQNHKKISLHIIVN